MSTPSTPLHEAVADLRDGLGEAIAVFDEQDKHVQAARQRAEATRELFPRFMEHWPTEGPASSAATERQLVLDTLRSNHEVRSVEDDLRASAQLSVRWEQAFCAVYEALMCLYAYPEHQQTARQVAQIIRTIRLLQVEDVAPSFAPSLEQIAEQTALSARSGDPSSDNPSSRQGARKRQVLGFMDTMDGWHNQVQQSYEQKIQRTGELLNEAHAVASRLAESTQDRVA